MDLKDAELITALTARDGPLPERGLPHSAYGGCRFREALGGRECPWCAAEARRSVSQRSK